MNWIDETRALSGAFDELPPLDEHAIAGEILALLSGLPQVQSAATCGQGQGLTVTTNAGCFGIMVLPLVSTAEERDGNG